MMRTALAFVLLAGCTVDNPNYTGNTVPGLEPGQSPAGDLSHEGHDAAVDLSTSAPPDFAFVIGCGDPGDPGNSLGVGKYCDSSATCFGQSANFCATAINPAAHFCTMQCQQGQSCGDGASCVCGNGGCGCVPDACGVNNPPPPDLSTPPQDLSSGQCIAAGQSCLGVLQSCCGGLTCAGIPGRCCVAKGGACSNDRPCCTGSCSGGGTCN